MLWSKLRHIRFEKPAAPGDDIIMLYKYVLNEPFHTAVVGVIPRQERKSDPGVTLSKFDLKQSYNGILPVSEALKNDLISLCKINAIPPMFQQYYYDLKTNENMVPPDLDDIDPNRDTDNEEE